MADVFTCNLCVFSTDVYASFQKHFVRNHKHDPHFSVACCIDSCAYTSQNWNTYKVHVHRKHSHINTEEPLQEIEDEDDGVEAPVVHAPAADLPHFNAMFTLCLESKHNMSQSAIDNIVSTTSSLVESQLGHFKDQLKEKLQNAGIDPDIVEGIDTSTYLELFSSDSKRKSYYRKKLDTLVQPQKVDVGEKFVTKNGVIQEVTKHGYIIPFKECLQQLLQLPEVWEYVQNPHVSSDEYMYDICDGDVLATHPLFSNDRKALQVILNCDDMEIVNPLGSHVKKHKITMFYFTLGNIPPEFRSKLQAIQLLAVCRSKDARNYESEVKLLSDFIQTIAAMEQDGIELDLHGSKHTIRGTLVTVSADTLASNWLGKFKEGVAFALKNCRRCEVENTHLKHVFSERQVSLRSREMHLERYTELSQMSKQARQYWSKLWGINDSSILLKIDGFDLMSGLVQDPMHVLLEGVVPHELSQLLYRFIYVQSLFTLKWLNTAISGFCYSYLHTKARPEPIEKKHIDGTGSIKQTAAAMLTLVHTLSIIIGHKIPPDDVHWVNALRLIQIVLFCTSSYCSRDTAMYLRILIAEFLHNFKLQYPKASFIPKMHYMVHMPSQMLMYGPLRHHWVMRFEGKNGYFANKKYKNFRNIPLTLASRHQMYMAYMQTGHENGRSGSFLYEGDSVGRGTEILLTETYPELVQSMQELTGTDLAAVHVYQTDRVSVHGHEYRNGCAMVLDYEDDLPVFVVLLNIVVHEHVKYFVLEKMEFEFDAHILCFVLKPTGQQVVCQQSRMKFKWPLSVYNYQGSKVVMNVNSHTYMSAF
jgi:hypothetical protein